MRYRLQQRRAAVRYSVAFLILPIVTGCSIPSYGLGAPIDAANRSVYAPPRAAAIGALERGQRITVQHVGSWSIAGRFPGLESVAADAYAARYDSARAGLPDSIAPPSLGDTVAVAVTSGDTLRGVFRGVDEGAIVVETAAGEVDVPSGGGPDVGGWSGFVNAMPRLPWRTAVALEGIGRGPAWRSLVPLDQIVAIERTPHTARTTALILGGIVDLSALVITFACVATGCLDFGFWGAAALMSMAPAPLGRAAGSLDGSSSQPSFGRAD